MPEPITLAVLGGVALTEGVKFLYAQAGEAIKRYYENQKAAHAATAIPSEGKAPDIIEGGLKPLTIHIGELEKVVPQLEPLAAQLYSYGNGYKELEPTDTDILQKMDILRRLLEAVYKQPLTFRGEIRPASAINVDGNVNVTNLYGTAIGIEVDTIADGNVTGTGTADTIHPGGTLFGTKVQRIGGS